MSDYFGYHQCILQCQSCIWLFRATLDGPRPDLILFVLLDSVRGCLTPIPVDAILELDDAKISYLHWQGGVNENGLQRTVIACLLLPIL